MPIALPGPTIPVLWQRLMLLATWLADKDPGFSLFELYPKQGCFFLLASMADFGFHAPRFSNLNRSGSPGRNVIDGINDTGV